MSDAPRDPIEAPATEAGRNLLGVPYLAGDAESEGVDLRTAILAIEAAARDEGRREAVREIRQKAKPLAIYIAPDMSMLLDDVARTKEETHDATNEPRTRSGIALERLMAVINERTTIEPRHRPAIRASLRAYRRAIEAEAGAAPSVDEPDVDRLAEAWGNVMDGRRIGEGIGAARINADTTTADDWQSIAAEYRRLSRAPQEGTDEGR